MAGENVLIQARHAAGLSQAALASRAGTPRPTLSTYERDRTSPPLCRPLPGS
ncbi:MAG: helix-turn-helix transcriptional regulator [Ornithinimicrobium sp.]|uniref:helix-turn-helix transcriptional regulator n=1 Tax=Ornithinimicrobium sp. TaxID=1977084 RepID=UPI0026E0F3B1|nr:helix-turn-helix transcriptional regulator [Ornithinimicrobium sp.]MDO5738631.1 helix-turn-helix transcriptional regulator [Ornithinimicrobium sp.]